MEERTFKFHFIEDLIPDMHKKLSNKDYYSENEKKFSMGSYKRNIQVLKK